MLASQVARHRQAAVWRVQSAWVGETRRSAGRAEPSGGAVSSAAVWPPPPGGPRTARLRDPQELMEAAGISADRIAQAARDVVGA